MPNKLKELLLGRGWAGRTITRAETVERLNPIVKEHIVLNHNYEAAIRSLGRQDMVEALREMQRTSRMDVGKLSETIFSAGGAAYNGTDLEPDQYDLGNDGLEIVNSLIEQERDFKTTVETEREDIEHQMRTRAILELVASNSHDRLKGLEKMKSQLTRR
ncbi:hypothetical protein CRI94_12905 [Longibacter salinarum]|uniref:DUF2383 domain-containing protein n=1 Tax=Longibacter salinarum TaxID=1850348 RepID=A0A2A8CWC4_9BACT|nr:hypothetical protein [Longibacter salinarum]PEN12897.1 hypothetical protein CRI94_12905 [Longibacter salinarum]